MGFCQVFYETNFTTLCSRPLFINLLNLSACVLRYEADNDAKYRIVISCYVGNYPTTGLRFLYLLFVSYLFRLCVNCVSTMVFIRKVAEDEGFEPSKEFPLCWFSRPVHSTALPIFLIWWSWRESNPRPPACKAGALPTELQPLIL